MITFAFVIPVLIRFVLFMRLIPVELRGMERIRQQNYKQFQSGKKELSVPSEDCISCVWDYSK
jgi:hypothetical protein